MLTAMKDDKKSGFKFQQNSFDVYQIVWKKDTILCVDIHDKVIYIIIIIHHERVLYRTEKV